MNKPESICTIPPSGWACIRESGHSGPCAAIMKPSDWTIGYIKVNHPEIFRNLKSITLKKDKYIETAADDIQLRHSLTLVYNYSKFSSIEFRDLVKDLTNMGIEVLVDFDEDTDTNQMDAVRIVGSKL